MVSKAIKMKSIRISFIFLWCFSHALYGQVTFTLEDCLIHTLENSPKLKAEKLNQQKEEAAQLQLKSNFLPHVDAFLNYHNYFNDLPTYIFPQPEGSNLSGIPSDAYYPIQLGLPHNLNTGLEINQTIFSMNFFGNREISEHLSNYKDLKLSIAEEDQLYEIAVLYYQIAMNEGRLDFLNMNLERLQKLLPVVALQVENGFAKPSDRDKLLVKTSNLRSQKNKLEAGIQQQMNYLKIVMGVDENEELALDHQSEELLRYDLAVLGEDEDVNAMMLKEQRALNQLNTRRINAEYYPKLQAYAAFLFQAQRDRWNFTEQGQDWYNIHQWGVKLSIPVMHGFEKKYRKELSEIVDQQLAFGIEQKHIQSKVEYENAVLNLEVARAEEKSQQENTELADRIFQQSELAYEEGTMLFMEFLDAEATLREAQMMYATAKLDTKLAELKILKVTGNLKDLIDQ